MKVLVTGASGFIGRHAIRALARQSRWEIVAAGRRPTSDLSPDIAFESIDLLEAGAPAALIARVRPSHLLHLAWNAEPGLFWNAADNLDWSVATAALISAFIRAKGQRAVVAGSCAEYDWTGPGRLEEGGSLHPATFYGCAKDATRRLACAAGEAAGLPIAWARIFWLYGPGESNGRLISDVAQALIKGSPVDTTEGRQRRDFIHVEDVAGALLKALDGVHHGPFNIGSGRAVPIREIIKRLADASGRSDLVRFGARPTPTGEPPLLEADTTILTERIGFRPSIDLSRGLAETMEWWRHRMS